MPTVITLVYGLGFGMFLVLVVTPSLVLVQHDIARIVTSTRRLLRALVLGKFGRRRSLST